MLRFGQFCVCLCALAAPVIRADEPVRSPPKSGRELDPAKLPPGSIIIISDNPREALRQVDAIVLSPVEYKKLLDAAEQGRREKDKPEVPSTCRISGRIERRGERGVAVLTANMAFRTTAPRTVVAIGLQQGRATAATLDGKLAAFAPSGADDGYAVVVDTPGEHSLQVDFESPLTVRPGEIGFEIGLPGAAITVLERMEFPKDVANIRIAGRSLAAGDLAGESAMLLGSARRLDVRWIDLRGGESNQIRLTAEARTDVVFVDAVSVSRTRLTVKWPAGSPAQFQVTASTDAKIEFEPAGSAIVADQSTSNGAVLWTIRPADHATESVIEVESRKPYQWGAPVSLGPARVVNAARQRGAITIGGGSNVRLILEPFPDASLVRRETPDSSANESTFGYSNLPGSGELVRVTPQQISGQIDTQFHHQLTLNDRGWRWQGRLEIRPVRIDVPFIDIEAPLELLEFRSASPESVESVTARDIGKGDRRFFRVQFVEPVRRATTITFEGAFDFPETVRDGVMSLPRVSNTVDRGGQLTATAASGIEVHGFVREWTGEGLAQRARVLEPAARNPNAVSCNTERMAGQASLNWRAADRESAISARVYIELGERQATVRHQFRLPTAASASLRLSGPPSLAGRIRGIQGTTLQPAGPGEWLLQPSASNSNETVATLTYGFPIAISAQQRTEEVPLVWLTQFADVETDVLIWSGVLPNGTRRAAQAMGPWTEVAPPIVADMSALPSMALHGSGSDLPLTINLEDSSIAAPPILVERLWIQAVVDQDGRQYVRVRSLIRPQGAQILNLTFLRPIADLQFQALLDGKRLANVSGDNAETSVRLRVDPDAARASRLLEFTYLLPAGEGERRILTRIETPTWNPGAQLPLARWQFGFSDDEAALTFGPLERTETWSWQRAFLETQPLWNSNQLSKWLVGDARYGDLEANGVNNSITARGAIGSPVWLVLVSRSTARLVCSLGFLTIAIGLLVLSPPLRLGLMLTLIVLFGVVATLNWQIVIAIALFSQPGAVVVALILLGRALFDRWRRPTVFQEVQSWSGPATLPLAPTNSRQLDSPAGDSEPDLIPLKRV